MAFFAGVSGAVFFRHWAVVSSPFKGTVVFLHGLGQHSGDYHHFAAALNRAGVSVWALDHVGHGLTEGELGVPGPMLDLAANAARLIDLAVAAGEGGRLVLMGHSLGAGVALSLATTSPGCAHGLLLCGAPLGPPRRKNPNGALRDGDRTQRWRSMREQGAAQLAAMPALALHGEDDRIIPIEGVRATLREVSGIRLVSYPDAGHDLLHEDVRDAVAARTVEFVLNLR